MRNLKADVCAQLVIWPDGEAKDDDLQFLRSLQQEMHECFMVNRGSILAKEKDLELFSILIKRVTWMDESVSAESLDAQRLRVAS